MSLNTTSPRCPAPQASTSHRGVAGFSPVRVARTLARTVAVSRRSFLSLGGAGTLGLTLPAWLRASEIPRQAGQTLAPGKARRVLFLHQFGGPSHIDTFDPKPDAPEEIRGEFATIPTSVAGLRFGEGLPRLAAWANRMAVVRSVHHRMRNHNPATYYSLTGRAPPLDDIRLRDSPELFPALGSVVARLRPAQSPGLPDFVALPHVLKDGVAAPGQHASFLGRAYDPLLVTADPAASDFQLPELALPADTSLDRLAHRRALMAVVDRQAQLLEYSAAAQRLDTYQRRAFEMLASPQVRKAFDLAGEPDSLRDAYGRTTYGQSCLLARRLLEHGVPFVNVYFARGIGNADRDGWDTHAHNFRGLRDRLLPLTDQVVPTLLADMASRGLLDETLVIWMGEFGRSPRIANSPQFGPHGRDHWPECYSMFFAGAGVQHGAVYGSSDRHGAYPATHAVAPDAIAATMYAALGLSEEAEIHDLLGRPLSIAAAKPIREILA